MVKRGNKKRRMKNEKHNKTFVIQSGDLFETPCLD
jgi:hypothetical protein